MANNTPREIKENFFGCLKIASKDGKIVAYKIFRLDDSEVERIFIEAGGRTLTTTQKALRELLNTSGKEKGSKNNGE